MAFNPLPRSFFGVDYVVASSAISFGTATKTTGIACATFTAAPSANVITTLSAHNLKVGDAIRFTGAAVGGITLTFTTYYVLTVPTPLTLTISASAGGAVATLSAGAAGTTNILSLGILDGLTDAEAEAAAGVGDWRKVIGSFMEMLFKRWTATAVLDRPAKLTISRTSGVDPVTLEVVLTYTVRVVNAPAPLDVANE